MVKFAKKQTCAKILWLNGKNPFPKASKCAELWRRVWSLYGKVRSFFCCHMYITVIVYRRTHRAKMP